jgi:hypothetical protein
MGEQDTKYPTSPGCMGEQDTKYPTSPGCMGEQGRPEDTGAVSRVPAKREV